MSQGTELLRSSLMPTDHIVDLLIAEREKLDRAIEALRGTSATPKKPAATATEPTATAPKKRHVSAAARRRMAEGQKKRWAAIKAKK
jgi:hypothetical protein